MDPKAEVAVLKEQLFRGAAGELVQVVDVSDGTVSFCPQGGGFRCRTAQGNFTSRFSPVAALPEFRTVLVNGDWLDPQQPVEGFCNGMAWNGWVMPYFSFEVATRLAARMPVLRYVQALDAFVTRTDLEPFETGETPSDPQVLEVYAAVTLTVGGTSIKAYPIGAGSWCWERAS